MSAEISIIIPIYNVEKYLKDCLESVLNSQLSVPYEVILIDDGSKDDSGTIADSYSRQFEHFHVFHYANEGLSAARNKGLAKAEGNYIFFLDSDDIIEKDYIEHLYRKAVGSKCDLVIAGFTKFTAVSEGAMQDASIEKRSFLKEDRVRSGCEILKERMDQNDWKNQVWCSLYDRNFLLRNDLKFEEDIRIYEDVYYTNKVLLAARRVGTITEYGYGYRMRSQSLVSGGPKQKDVDGCHLLINRFVDRYSALNEEEKQLWGRVLIQIISMDLTFIGMAEISDKKKEYRLIQSKPVLSVVKKSISSKKEWVKYLIFRFAISLYYHLVREKV